MTWAIAPIVLGSGSPRRRDMLTQLGLPLIVAPPHVDETAWPGMAVESYVREISARKLQATLARWQSRAAEISGILCADTVVSIDGEILQKPQDLLEAEQMVRRLVGRTHQVMTAYDLWSCAARESVQGLVASDVTFRSAHPEEIRWYASTGEGLDKAGAYAAQGVGAVFIEQISGSYSNVVGLPLCELWQDLQRLRVVESFP